MNINILYVINRTNGRINHVTLDSINDLSIAYLVSAVSNAVITNHNVLFTIEDYTTSSDVSIYHTVAKEKHVDLYVVQKTEHGEIDTYYNYNKDVPNVNISSTLSSSVDKLLNGIILNTETLDDIESFHINDDRTEVTLYTKTISVTYILNIVTSQWERVSAK